MAPKVMITPRVNGAATDEYKEIETRAEETNVGRC